MIKGIFIIAFYQIYFAVTLIRKPYKRELMSVVDLLILFASSITILIGIYSNNVKKSNFVGIYIANALIISLNFLISILSLLIYIRSQLAISTFGNIAEI